MDKPIYLKVELFDHIIEFVNTTTLEELIRLVRKCGYNIANEASKDDVTKVILEKPASFLEQTGLLDNEDWLTNLVIEFDDGVEYYLTEQAAKEIALENDFVLLTRLIDKKPVVQNVETIRKALRANNGFDYLETLEKKRKNRA